MPYAFSWRTMGGVSSDKRRAWFEGGMEATFSMKRRVACFTRRKDFFCVMFVPPPHTKLHHTVLQIF